MSSCPEALQTPIAVVAGNVCACILYVCVYMCVCVPVWARGRDREGSVCGVCQRVCVCSALRGGRLRLSQREVGRLATR